MKELRPEAKEAYNVLRTAWKQQFNEDLPEEPDKYCQEILENYPEVGEGDTCPGRHWDEVQVIFRVGMSHIRASIAKTTGDVRPKEMGWEFDPNSMAVVYPVKVMITKYRTIGEMTGRK